MQPETLDAPPWWIYRGVAGQDDGGPGRDLPAPPPWRTFAEAPDDADFYEIPDDAGGDVEAGHDRRLGKYRRQATTYVADDKEISLVNLAIYLRRPLLVTGQPGVGKSTLIYSVAEELKLGPVLRWPITSRSTLTEGSTSTTRSGDCRK